MTRMTRATYAGSLLLVALDFALFALVLLVSALLVRRIEHIGVRAAYGSGWVRRVTRRRTAVRHRIATGRSHIALM